METRFAEVPNVVRALGAHLVGLMRRELKLILGTVGVGGCYERMASLSCLSRGIWGPC